MYISREDIEEEAFDALDFNKRLKAWYIKNHRKLLWRETKDPYKIWLSEVILQQTRVAQGTPYYERFVAQYPDVASLAAADERDVLRLWQGLGYYSRARNMHHTARMVMADYNGYFPRTSSELRKLKGLGEYTAAAIASFSFDERIPAIDGNVFRVMSRLFGIREDILSGAGKKAFTKLASLLISEDDPATYNQAMIEFGALQCVPVSPDCASCIFDDICFANRHSAQATLPVKVRKVTIRNRFFNYLIVEYDGKLALRERKGRDIWHGLFEFPMNEGDSVWTNLDEAGWSSELVPLLKDGVLREIPEKFFHILTHQRLTAKFWWVKLNRMPSGLAGDFRFYSVEEVEDLPKPILIDNVLRAQGYLD